MKKTIQVLALVLAIGATAQTLKAYAFESQAGSIMVDDEEYKIMRLMELRKEIESKGESLVIDPTIQSEFPEIKKASDLTEVLAHHMTRYMQGMCAGATLSRIVNSAQTKSISTQSCGGNPGI